MHNGSYHKPNEKSNSKCSVCGWQISHPHTFDSMLSGQFSNERNGDFTATKLTPFRPPSIEADVLVPGAQSLITSTQATISAIPLSIWLQWEWPFLLFIWAGTMLLSWISAVRRAEETQTKTEEFSYTANEKLAGQVASSVPSGPLQLEVIHTTSGLRNQMQILDLPDQITEASFVKFLQSALAGKSLARSGWAGTGKDFSRDGYDGMIEALLTASVIQPSVKGGKLLTNGGRRAVTRLLREGGV